ncbi:MAG: 2-hydroxychromene-2-carboxylate isomerase [Halieaceae bacterium]
MATSVDFYFDIVSPTAFLAYHRLRQLQEKYGLDIVYKPMLLGGVFKATGNTTPIAIPAKGKYMLEQDVPRFAARYGVELNFNPHFPINSLTMMRGTVAAQRMGCADAFIEAAFSAMWQQEKDLGDPAVIAEVLADAGLDGEAILQATQDPEVKAALVASTDEAVARGAFGAPTMFVGDEFFFGQDRIDFIEEMLVAAA